MIAITLAKIGRSMKKRENMMVLARGPRTGSARDGTTATRRGDGLGAARLELAG